MKMVAFRLTDLIEYDQHQADGTNVTQIVPTWRGQVLILDICLVFSLPSSYRVLHVHMTRYQRHYDLHFKDLMNYITRLPY